MAALATDNFHIPKNYLKSCQRLFVISVKAGGLCACLKFLWGGQFTLLFPSPERSHKPGTAWTAGWQFTMLSKQGEWVQKPCATRPALWRKNRTMTDQCPTFTLGEFFTNTFQEIYHREHPKCGCATLKSILTMYLESIYRERCPLCGTTSWLSQIHPTLQKFCEIPSSKICLLPLDHKGLLFWGLLTSCACYHIFKARNSSAVHRWHCWPKSCWF